MTDPYGQPAQRPQDHQGYPPAPQGHALVQQGYAPPAQGYAPPAPGYGYAPPPPAGAAPPNYLVWSIISIFLFWPLAIAAIIKSNSVDRLWAEGRFELSQQASKSAKLFCLISTIIGIALFALIFVLFFVLAATVSQLPNIPIN